MELILAIIVGLLYAAGIFLMMRRSFVKLIIGLTMLGNGANLLIFLLGRIVKGEPAFIGSTQDVLKEVYADPVPQALILTAIVIGFGLQSFAIVLVRRVFKVVKTDDLDQINANDQYS